MLYVDLKTRTSPAGTVRIWSTHKPTRRLSTEPMGLGGHPTVIQSRRSLSLSFMATLLAAFSISSCGDDGNPIPADDESVFDEMVTEAIAGRYAGCFVSSFYTGENTGADCAGEDGFADSLDLCVGRTLLETLDAKFVVGSACSPSGSWDSWTISCSDTLFKDERGCAYTMTSGMGLADGSTFSFEATYTRILASPGCDSLRVIIESFQGTRIGDVGCDN